MSLATRCTACGTAFRVVQDQLKVSEGWVRCGQCRAVFSAFEQLFDLDRDAAGVPPEPARAAVSDAGGRAADEHGPPLDSHPIERREPSVGTPSGDGRPAVAAPAEAGATAIEAREAPSEPREDAGPPTVYAALDELETPDVVADAPGELPAARDSTVHPAEPRPERREATDAAPLALAFDASPDDDDSPLLPPLETEAREAERPDAPFLAPELDPDLEADDTVRLPPVPASSATAPPSREPDVAVDEWAAQAAHDSPSLIDKDIDAHLFGKRRHARRHAPAVHVSARDQIDFSDARFDSNLLTDEETLEGEVAPSERGELPLETAVPPAVPEFLRRGERRARWQRPAVRAALWSVSIVLAALLVLQATHHFRDDLAVRWPALKPALVAWCGLASCTLEPPRRIDDITVENTALARASSDAFRLAVTLRNHATVPVALPAVDLSLTDGSGRLVARRALSARDFKISPAVLPPNAEVALEAPIATRNTRVSGYTVEIFYP